MHTFLLTVVTILIALMAVLLLVSCAPSPIITPTPQPQHPQVTMTVWLLNTPTPTLTVPATRPTTAALLDVQPPTCYELPERQLWCLGRVWNGSTQPLENVRLTFDVDGRVQTVRLEQRVVHAGEFAPYRLVIQGASTRPPRLLSQQAQPSTAKPTPLRLLALDARYLADAQSYGRYELELSVVNDSPAPVYKARLIITLLDQAGRVVGYRVVEIADELNAGARLPVLASIVPLALAESYTPLVTLASDPFPTLAPR